MIIGKKAKNARCGHIHDTTAFFGGPKKSEKIQGYSWNAQEAIWAVNKEKKMFANHLEMWHRDSFYISSNQVCCPKKSNNTTKDI